MAYSQYTNMPRADLISELEAWHNKFNTRVDEAVKEQRAEYNKAQYEVRKLIAEKEAVFRYYKLDSGIKAAKELTAGLEGLQNRINATEPKAKKRTK